MLLIAMSSFIVLGTVSVLWPSALVTDSSGPVLENL